MLVKNNQDPISYAAKLQAAQSDFSTSSKDQASQAEAFASTHLAGDQDAMSPNKSSLLDVAAFIWEVQREHRAILKPRYLEPSIL